MLEVIRTYSKTWIAKLVLAMITLPFALWGIGSYLKGDGQGAAVASVGDYKISEHEFGKALQNQRDAMQAQGGKVDINNKAFRKQVLDQLVDTRLMKLAASKAGIVVSESQIMGALAGIPAFLENGVFSEERLDSWLRSKNISRPELLNMIHEDLLMRQMQFGYGEGGLISSTTAGLLAKQLAQQREVSEATFSAQTYLASINIDDKAVEAEYKANQAAYAIPPQVRVRYLVLSLDRLASKINIAEGAAKEYYEANKARYQEPEQRRASHILIKTDAGMPAAAKAEAKAKAEKILKEVQQTPAKFAELAKQNSQDPGSASRGGDLGSFNRDMMVKPFSDAVFSMKVGEISALVESEFGYHIIRLDGITPGTVLGFAAVEQDIIQELKRQEANRKFAELAERFSNIVYEQPDSLEPAAKELGLSVSESDWISQDKAEPAFLNNPRLLEAIFSPEALQKKQNTEAIEVGPSTLVSAHVIEHKPAGVRPLAEVSTLIRKRLAADAARAKAVEAGKAALASAEAGTSSTGFGAEMLVSRMQPSTLPRVAMKSVFQASASKLPSFVGVEMPDGYRVYRISKVIPGEPKAGQEDQIKHDVTRLAAQEELRAYLEYTRARNSVKINEGALEKKVE